MIVLVLFLNLGVLLGNVFGETSAGNLADAQQGLADSSWPKKPGERVSAFSGKMTDFKQIDLKNYEKGKSFQGTRMYGNQKESGLASTPLWEQKSSPLAGKDSSWAGRSVSSMSAQRNQKYGDAPLSSWQDKDEFKTKSLASKDAPDWIARSSSKFQSRDGGLVMYEGRLTRVRETVAREDDTRQRDLGAGKKEMFSPSEVQKLLEAKGRTLDPQQPSPVKGEIRAGSAVAFRPVVADSSPSSP